MLKYFYISFLLIISPNTTFSQQEGDQWVIGYHGGRSTGFSVMNLDFRSGNLEITYRSDLTMKINETASNICNMDGEPIIWTNGMEIFGRNGVKIADTIAYSGSGWQYWNHYYSDLFKKPRGFPEIEGAIILPVPDKDDVYSVIYHSAEKRPGINYKIARFLEARIQVDSRTHEEGSSYTLMYKDSLIGDYLLWYSKRVEAVRHANGRDWWIIIFEEDTGQYYSFILDPNGIRLDHSSETAPVLSSSGAMSSFSPNGKYFARMDAPGHALVQYLTLYAFDRCTGDLEILETMQATGGSYTAPSFSPDERYLYGNNTDSLWQWDLTEQDISASKTLVDTYDGFVPTDGWATVFGPQILGPDGRIYIIPPAGSSSYMHVIDRPNLPAAETRFMQHHINLNAYNGRSAPNIPNFRLGPLDGSPCDTLGIDNIPVSRWRHEENEPGWYHQIRFTDLSFYDPQNWYWDFGDGETSDEQSPVHYFEDGLYHVCLTVSNDNGTDSTCQWIEILPTDISEPTDTDSDLSIHPNPFDTELHIQSKSGVFRTASFQFFDMHGRLVLHQPEIPVPLKISLPSLPSGMYLCRIEEGDGTLYSFKVMKR